MCTQRHFTSQVISKIFFLTFASFIEKLPEITLNHLIWCELQRKTYARDWTVQNHYTSSSLYFLPPTSEKTYSLISECDLNIPTFLFCFFYNRFSLLGILIVDNFLKIFFRQICKTSTYIGYIAGQDGVRKWTFGKFDRKRKGKKKKKEKENVTVVLGVHFVCNTIFTLKTCECRYTVLHPTLVAD